MNAVYVTIEPTGLEFQNIITASSLKQSTMWEFSHHKIDAVNMSTGNRGILKVFRRAAKKAKNFRLFTKRLVRGV